LLDTAVRPLYDARGRVRAAFPEVKAEQDKQVEGLVLAVRVEEGESYKLGEVTVEGGSVAPAELLKAAALKPGDVFNGDELKAAAARVEKRVRREGYMQVKTTVERRIDDKVKAVYPTIRVSQGPQYRFAKLNIEGLDLITEPAVRKLWAMKEGQPFNADYPDYFLTRIREDGIFDNLGSTKAIIDTDDTAHLANVTLIFKGQPPPKPPQP
jgi:outer membrane protein insertion porin family